ncbi:uncharacterized protein CG3556 [Caerostris extrusa]|uniref:Uncharacterized protein CG3556 n=1 Tax=Caerostris extrusa TaxID=172846 RepID=A0AAV4WIH0_CAEEX|nr:uncharacterized protein CG3556 [Caerostris extrusa]
MKVEKNRSPVSNIQSKLGPKMKIRYYFYIGDKKDQVHLLELKAPSNITVLDAMRLAVDADSKYRFLGKRIKEKFYIHELFGIANDPEDGKFWLLYVSNGNSPLEIITKKVPRRVYLKNDDQIVMWYKTAQISLE